MPLVRRTLPNLTLRVRLYKCLAAMPITPEYLKNSERGGPGMGKIIMMLFKHPQETGQSSVRPSVSVHLLIDISPLNCGLVAASKIYRYDHFMVSHFFF